MFFFIFGMYTFPRRSSTLAKKASVAATPPSEYMLTQPLPTYQSLRVPTEHFSRYQPLGVAALQYDDGSTTSHIEGISLFLLKHWSSRCRFVVRKDHYLIFVPLIQPEIPWVGDNLPRQGSAYPKRTITWWQVTWWCKEAHDWLTLIMPW